MRIRRPASPKMPEYSDYSSSAAGDFVTDGASEETPGLTDQASADASSAGSTVDTSAIENAIEQATSDLADLQSDLASKKSIAEADSASLTEEEKEKIRLENQKFSENGLRVLAFAYKESEEVLCVDTECGYTFLGLISMWTHQDRNL